MQETEKPKERRRSYWLKGVFFDQGWGWVDDFRELPSINGYKRWSVEPTCLGREEVLVPILKGKEPIPEDMNPKRKELLQKVLEDVNGTESTTGKPRLQRARPARTHGHRQRNTRHLKAREKLPLR